MHVLDAIGVCGSMLYSKPVKPLVLWVAPQAAYTFKCPWRQFLCLLLLLALYFSEITSLQVLLAAMVG